MTSPAVARATVSATAQRLATRDQIAENAPRGASFSMQYQVDGVGYYAARTPVMFDCIFTGKPVFTSGVSVNKFSDSGHYQYPLCDCGVYKWVCHPTPEAVTAHGGALRLTADAMGAAPQGSNANRMQAVAGIDNTSIYDDDELLYTGAYLYFVVRADPVQNIRTDGSDLADLETLALTATGTDLTRLQKLIAEANESLWLQAHPPVASMTFSLNWAAMALKGLADDVMDQLHNDPAATPLSTQPSSTDGSLGHAADTSDDNLGTEPTGGDDS